MISKLLIADWKKYLEITLWPVYIYIYIYIYNHTHTYKHTHAYIYIYIYIYIQTHTHIHTRIKCHTSAHIIRWKDRLHVIRRKWEEQRYQS